MAGYPIPASLPDVPPGIPYVPNPDPLPDVHYIPHHIAPEDMAADMAATSAAAAAQWLEIDKPPAGVAGWWVDIAEGINYELDEQGDMVRHVGCTADARPFVIGIGPRATGVTLEALLISVARHRNAHHGGRPE